MPHQDQIDNISKLLLEYSAGNYAYKSEISDELDDYDMIISGINMLGEELESSNVSKEYFSSIFNAVSDLILILDEKGYCLDANRSFKSFVGEDFMGENFRFEDFFTSGKTTFKKIQQKLNKKSDIHQFEETIICNGNRHVFVVFISKIINRYGKFEGFLISLRDVTEERERETQILKAIFTAQQKEQKRVADDLHDSLGQELSMTKLMLSHLTKEIGTQKRALELLGTCTDIIEQSIAHLREICFDMMPGVLTRGGIRLAIEDLKSRLDTQMNFKTELYINAKILRLDSDLETALYRVTQEFINNMIKHSNADKLIIKLDLINESDLVVELTENGQGFDMKKLEKVGENRGVSNLYSKAKAFNGELTYISEIDKGTRVKIVFPNILLK